MKLVGRGFAFDDLQVGFRFRTHRRTITEADVVAFAGLSGDYNQIHTDAAYSATTPFGQRIAHGFHIVVLQQTLLEDGREAGGV